MASPVWGFVHKEWITNPPDIFRASERELGQEPTPEANRYGMGS